VKPEAPLWVPLLNTALIVLSGLFLLAGYAFIRRGRIAWHRRAMLTATVLAGLFLVVYVTRALLFETKLFAGTGLLRAAYLALLGTHMVAATAVIPFVALTLWRALRGQYRAHRRIARRTLPLWAYVVLSGWVVFVLLYLVG